MKPSENIRYRKWRIKMAKRNGKSGKRRNGNQAKFSSPKRSVKKPSKVASRVFEPIDSLPPKGPEARSNECVGTLRLLGSLYYVEPDPGYSNGQYGRISITKEHLNGAPIDMKVICEILNPSAPPGEYNGRISEVLGDPGRHDVAMLGIMRQYGLATSFNDSVLAFADQFPLNPGADDIEQALQSGRKDLRSLMTITIDGEDAKDLDDAISIERLPGKGYRLWVHIADVSHYVKEGSVLDDEASKRATSVYLVDRVVPMLPPRLSNGLCSLNPNAPRFTLTASMLIDYNGTVIEGDVFESIINSNMRTSYNEVYALLFDPGEMERLEPLRPMLESMKDLTDILIRKRKNRGAMEFSFPETHVDLDEVGRPVNVFPYPINQAHRIIEEFMIVCNEFVAERFERMKAPFIYRIHEDPDLEKITEFLKLAKLFGAGGHLRGKPTSKYLSTLMEGVKDEPFAPALSQVLLRSLAKAVYSKDNLGHFGLSSESYCHFTSPIRRYPDLYIHRIIKSVIHDRGRLSHFSQMVENVSAHSSEMERNAVDAERASVELKTAEYMADHIGEIFDGTVSGMISGGIFIRLDSSIEGMAAFRVMDDYYEYDERRLEARGKRSGNVIRIGQRLKVRVASVDLSMRRIDFEPQIVSTEKSRPIKSDSSNKKKNRRK